MLMWLIIAGVAAIVVFIGLWPRKGGPEPRCRTCAFDLTGLEQAKVCPECGSDLGAKGAVRIGRARRRWWVALAGAVGLLVSGSLGGHAFYLQVTGTGWEHRAPGWWLAEWETRFATGSRLQEAYMGLRFGRSKGRVSQAVYDRATVIAFERMMTEAETLTVQRPDRFLAELAADAAANGKIDPARVQQLVKHLIVVRQPVITGRRPYPQGQEVEAYFVPEGWRVSYAWSVFDEDGNELPVSGKGHITKTSRGTSSGNRGMPSGLTRVKCRWDITLEHGEDAPLQWRVEYEVPVEGEGEALDVPRRRERGTGG